MRQAVVSVVGGVNVDIGGKSFSPLIQRDSNPGEVTVSFGGVGRNIAHNLRLLEVPTRLFTAVGEDAYAEGVLSSLDKLGVQTDCILRVRGGKTSTYLYLDDCDGDMALAVSDMKICEEITPCYLEQYLDRLNASAAVAADTNLPEKTLRWLACSLQVPLFVDLVSVKKASKAVSVLPYIHTLKANRLEAQYLSGVEIIGEEALSEAAERLLDQGVKRVFITLGEKGALAACKEQMVRVDAFSARQGNATGAGDAFMAALVWAFLEERSLEDSCRLSCAAASLAVQSEKTVSENMSKQAVLAISGAEACEEKTTA